MSKVVNGRIILDKEESKEFLKDIFHPDVEVLKKGMHSSEILKIDRSTLRKWPYYY